MNDLDVDRLLTSAGDSWRDGHAHQAAVDWAAVTGRRRRVTVRFAVVATAAVAAAVAVVVPVVVSRHATSSPTPGHRPTPAPTPTPSASSWPTPPPQAAGAPAWFFALSRGRIARIDARSGTLLGAASITGHRVMAIGSSPDGRIGYAATRLAGCRLRINADDLTGRVETWRDVATVNGRLRIAASDGGGIAVSSDGTKLALAVEECGTKLDAEDLVVVDTATGTSRRWLGYRNPDGSADISYLDRLTWSPDGRYLASVGIPCCGGGYDGTRLVDTNAQGASYVTQPVVVPQYTADVETAYGPVLWWQGHLAVVVGGSVREIVIGAAAGTGANRHTGTVGRVLARGFPPEVETVSVDATGQHALVVGTNGNGRIVFRWDRGVLTALPGQWIQPAW